MRGKRLLIVFAAVWLLVTVCWAGSPSLGLFRAGNSNEWISIQGSADAGFAYELWRSPDLMEWSRTATILHAPFSFSEPASANRDRFFYRMRLEPRTEDHDWKNLLLLTQDPFASRSGYRGQAGSSSLAWIKFAILLDDPARVIFQESGKYPFHHEFATARLEPFRGMSPAEFEAVSMRRLNQQVALGTVLWPAGFGLGAGAGSLVISPSAEWYGIQFSGLDSYPPELVAGWFKVVASAIESEAPMKRYYIPTFEQSQSAQLQKSYFAEQGIEVRTWAELTGPADEWPARGWAMGRLKFFAAAEIEQAFGDGRLQPGDILLTDGVPAELPPLAGVISLSPVSPNSHAVLLAQASGMPILYVASAATREWITNLVGQEIIFPAGSRGAMPLGEWLPENIRSELLALKRPPALRFPAKAQYGQLSIDTTALTPADTKFVGGKAANYGLLRRTVPSHARPAIAMTFDLWEAFISQKLPGGTILKEEIGRRLSAQSNPPVMSALRQELAEIRRLITSVAVFAPEQREAILAALAGFDPGEKIRFRSSTNVEDTEQFIGAGLYDSYSGCLGDDLDGDSTGPSGCDPGENQERGVFRAIQRVYASFYNENAVLERLRHRVPEANAGMALLVHRSFPDEIELANGVAVVKVSQQETGTTYLATVSTQPGAFSVTNPEVGETPEVVTIIGSIGSTNLTIGRWSGRLRLGEHPLAWPGEYLELFGLLKKVTEAYGVAGSETSFTLDFEFKKTEQEGLVLKQVRKVPAATQATTAAYLIGPAIKLETRQGIGKVVDHHRLKSRWEVRPRNVQITEQNIKLPLLTWASIEMVKDGEASTIEGAFPVGTNPSHESRQDDWSYFIEDRWGMAVAGGTRKFNLALGISKQISREAPIVGLNDLAIEFQELESEPSSLSKTAAVTLEPAKEAAVSPVSYAIATNGLSVVTIFYRSVPEFLGEGVSTFARFVETRIEGLTREPIVLKDYFSQTRGFAWARHNGWEEFLFEPALEPNIMASQLAELAAKDVVQILIADRTGEVFAGYYDPKIEIFLVGADGKIRRTD